jgi:putative aspartyl protease
MEHSIQHTILKVGLPLIVTSNKPTLCFLIDTGATNNVIFSFAYEHLKSVFNTIGRYSRIMGVDGETKETAQVEATLSFGNIHTTSIYSVLESHKAVATIQNETGIQIHGILGIPFLTQNKWLLDFNKLTVKISET